MRRLRLFFAVWPPRGVREALWHALAPLRKSGAGVRWVPPERLHITLRFMGDISAEVLPCLLSAAEALKCTAPFRARLTGAGTFPRRAPPRVYWVGIRAAAMLPLREGLDVALAEEGIEREDRIFSPHLTVGRTRGGRPSGARPRARQQFGDFVPVGLEFTVAAVHLVRSDLFPEGPRYANVHKVVLGRR